MFSVQISECFCVGFEFFFLESCNISGESLVLKLLDLLRVSMEVDWQWLKDFLKGMIKPVAALSVVVMAMILSYLQKLGLEGEMMYSIFRAFIQLSVIGFVLQFIFNQNNSGWIVLAYLFMVKKKMESFFCSVSDSFNQENSNSDRYLNGPLNKFAFVIMAIFII